MVNVKICCEKGDRQQMLELFWEGRMLDFEFRLGKACVFVQEANRLVTALLYAKDGQHFYNLPF